MVKTNSAVLGTLVVLGGGECTWVPALENAGWLCHRSLDLRAAERLLLETGPCIGVVDLTRDNFSLQGIAGLVNRNKQARWLALVRDDQLRNDAICQFIVNFCVDYFTAPVPEGQWLKTIGHQLGMLQLERRVWPELGQFGQHGLQGEQPAMQKLQHQVKRLAMTDMPVLVLGEIGTGKELVAQAIHQPRPGLSLRSSPLIVKIWSPIGAWYYRRTGSGTAAFLKQKTACCFWMNWHCLVMPANKISYAYWKVRRSIPRAAVRFSPMCV